MPKRDLPLLVVQCVCILILIASKGNALTDPISARSSPSYKTIEGVKRVFCLSDLHTDHVENMEWLRRNIAASDLCQDDLLIVAGDVSHESRKLQESLRLLRQTCQIFFLPGNHEAWIGKHDKFESSLDKLYRVERTCRIHGVHVDALFLGGKNPLWVVPLQSWYDGTLTFNEELCKDFGAFPWVDFMRCRWSPRDFPPMSKPNKRIPKGLVEYFHEKYNEPILSEILLSEASTEQHQKSALLTVSHFLPNKQCLPDWNDLDADENEFSMDWLNHGAGEMSAKFAKVAGSQKLDDQLRSLSAEFSRHIHIFGHSHRPKDFDYKGVRYIHNPLGKPRERTLQMVNPEVTFQCIWNVDDKGEVPGPTVLRYWEQFGGGTEALRERLKEVKGGRYRLDSNKKNSSQSTVY